MKLRITEKSAWTGLLYEVSIDGDAASFTGAEIYRDRFPANIALRPESVQQLKDATSFLELEQWRDSYRPEDVGSVVDDGGSWNCVLDVTGSIMRSAGDNAFPSYSSPSTTSLHEERFGLLRESVFAAIKLSVPYGCHAGQTKAEQGVAPQSATRSESNPEGSDTPQPESEARSR